MRSLILNIGTSCFVRCPGCYNHFADSLRKKTTVSNAEILVFIKKMQDKEGLKKLTIGGGDPLSRPDIIELLQQIKEMGIQIHLDTVGTAFLHQAQTIFFGRVEVAQVPILPFIQNIDRIGIPLDGSEDSIARLFRQGRTNFVAEQIAIIRRLAQAGAKLCINTVVHRQNIDDIPALYQLIKEEKIQMWQLFQFMPIGELGYKNRSDFEIETTDFETLRAYLLQLNADFKIECKSESQRKNNYMIVDDEGIAWLPEEGSGRRVLGHINDLVDSFGVDS